MDRHVLLSKASVLSGRRIFPTFCVLRPTTLKIFSIISIGAASSKNFDENRSQLAVMASKTPGTPRKSSSARKSSAKQSKTVTPIDQAQNPVSVNGVAEPSTIAQLEPELQEEIRRRAYELYEERGRQDGFHQDDWKRAETEVLSRYQREKSA